MMSTSQSGVIACRSISTPRMEATQEKPSPLKAWPEVSNWLIYHTLPTINALYRPDFLPNLDEMVVIDSLLDGLPSLEEMIRLLIREFPTPELFISQLMPQIEQYVETVYEYYESQHGIKGNKQFLQHALANVVGSLDELDISNNSDDYTGAWCLTTLSAMASPDDAYSLAHEDGHFYSFQLTRPAITEFKDTWSKIDDLLQQAATGVQDDFWDKFNDYNNKLENCLSISLALEELRANFFVIDVLPPEIKASFIERIYKTDNKNKRKREREIFDSLLSVTGGRSGRPILLTVLAECLDPFNPVAQIELLLNSLQAEHAPTWTDEQWSSWFEQWYRLDKWETVMNANQDLIGKTYTALPKAMLTGRIDGMVVVSCNETMRLPVFYESMRQQLFRLRRVRTLTCPFKG
jgi:hypothetical protein